MMQRPPVFVAGEVIPMTDHEDDVRDRSQSCVRLLLTPVYDTCITD